LVRAEPSLFSVGGCQSRVTTPFTVVTGGGGFTATVVGGVDGGVLEVGPSTLAVVGTPGERLIMPVLGATAAAVLLLPDPSPQAARERVASASQRRLRIM